MTMKHFTLCALASASACALLAGCGGGNSPLTTNQSGTFFGAARTLNQGSARSFVTLDGNGNPTTVGIKFTEAALQGLPTSGDPTTDETGGLALALPAQGSKTIFDHVSLDYEPNGHPPDVIYNVPHFDTHFYLLTPAEQAQITPGSDSGTPAPAPGVVPEPYISTVDTVPTQGVHWADPSGPEFNPPSPFSYTYIYGVTKGKLAFLEPMVSLSLLQSKAAVTTPIKQPTVFQKSGYYPTQYSIRYDDAAKEYTIALENMIKH